MARTPLTAQLIVSSGLKPTYGAANADGHTMANDGKKDTFMVKNGGGVSTSVTVPTTVAIDGLAVEDRVVAIPAGEERVIGGLNPAYYNNADGTVNIDITPTASVTIAYLRTP